MHVNTIRYPMTVHVNTIRCPMTVHVNTIRDPMTGGQDLRLLALYFRSDSVVIC